MKLWYIKIIKRMNYLMQISKNVLKYVRRGINMSERYVYDLNLELDKIKISDTGDSDKKPDKSNKRISPKILIIIGAVFALLIIVIMVLANFPKKEKYVITFDENCFECMLNGYDGYARLSVVPDYPSIYNSSIGVIRDKAEALEVDENELFKEFFNEIKIYPDINKELKNGDEVIITVYINEKYQEELGIKFQTAEYTYVVDSLETVTEIDPFERMQIFLKDIEGLEPGENFMLVFEDGYCGLTSLDFDCSVKESDVLLELNDRAISRLEVNGYKVINSEKKVDLNEVDGYLIKDFDEISQYSINALKIRAEKVIKEYYEGYNPESIRYHSGYVSTYETVWSGNRLNLIYEVVMGETTIYINVIYDNVVIEDGPDVIVKGGGPELSVTEVVLIEGSIEHVYGARLPDYYAIDAYSSLKVIYKDFDNEGIITKDYLEEKYGNN